MQNNSNTINISLQEKVKTLFSMCEKNGANSKVKINALFFRKNARDECGREIYVSLVQMLPIIEYEVDINEADYILYMHSYARIKDYSDIVLKELKLIDKIRKPGAKIIVVGKATNAETLINGVIENIVFYGDHYAEKTGQLLGFDTKEKYFVYDERDETLNIWPVDGCLKKCTFCRRTFMDIKFESISLEKLRGELDYYKCNEPEKLKKIRLRAENLTEYGIDIYNSQQLHTLINLMSSYEEVEEISFFIGLAIAEITPEILEAICNIRKIGEICLNFETGSDRLLKITKKGHTKEEAIFVYNKIRETHPEAYISSTIMLGLPTENIDDVLDTAEVINKTQIDDILVNRYGYVSKHPIAELPQINDGLFNYHIKILLNSVKKYSTRERDVLITYPGALNSGRRKDILIKKYIEQEKEKTVHGVQYVKNVLIKKHQ